MSDVSMNHVAPADDGGQQAESMQESQERSQEQKSTQPSIGAQLAAQREARGWTVEQVAGQLNFAVRQVQALEEDNFSALPGMVIVRGFIRAYAKLLKMDATPLLAMLATEALPPPIESLHSRPQLATPFSDTKRLTSKGVKASQLTPVLLVLGAVAIGIAAFAAYRFGWVQWPTLQQEKGTNTVATTVESAPLPAPLSSAPVMPPLESNKVASVPVNTVQGNEIPATAPVATESAANVQPVAAQTQAEKPVAASGQNTLVLKIHEASWIEIRRVSTAAPGASNVLLSRLEKAGATETFEVTEPIIVTIGNAGGVQATLRGEPVKLKPNAKSNIARLTLK